MKANRLKNANQICDQIYERQYVRLKKDYHSMRQDNTNKVKKQTFQEKRLDKLEKQVMIKHE